MCCINQHIFSTLPNKSSWWAAAKNCKIAAVFFSLSPPSQSVEFGLTFFLIDLHKSINFTPSALTCESAEARYRDNKWTWARIFARMKKNGCTSGIPRVNPFYNRTIAANETKTNVEIDRFAFTRTNIQQQQQQQANKHIDKCNHIIFCRVNHCQCHCLFASYPKPRFAPCKCTGSVSHFTCTI